MVERKLIKEIYIRVCKDSGYGLDIYRAAALTGRILKIHPLEVWMVVGTIDVMEEIATGTHPVCKKECDNNGEV